jgi:AcrR family transcriptional regulator
MGHVAARGSDGTVQAAGPAAPRRRAGLSQERSRDTRRRLVRAAMALWTERGFETGIEDTTIDEIVQAAGVTKGTFYFHFAHKEEILLELGYQTATALADEARRCIAAERSVDDSLQRIVATLTRSVKKTSPAAVGRAMAEFHRPYKPGSKPPSSLLSFADALGLVFEQAQERGEVTGQVPAVEMAQIVEALFVDSLMEWAQGRQKQLNASLQRRTAIVLAGLRPGNPLWA